MSEIYRNRVVLVLRGTLPEPEELKRALTVEPTRATRKGEPARPGTTWGYDSWVLELGEWAPNDETFIERILPILEKVFPGLRILDRTKCEAELVLSFIRPDKEAEEERFLLPPKLLSAAADASLPIAVSVLVL